MAGLFRGTRRIGGALIAVGAGAASLFAPSTAFAQDGWKIERHQRNRTTAAHVTFTTGQAIAVRCTRGHAEVVAIGLPVPTGSPEISGTAMSRRIETRLDGKDMPSSTWLAAADPTTVFYTAPGALARGLLTADELTLRIVPDSGPATRIVLPLPPDRTGLRSVLEGCGLPLVDPRDQAVNLTDLEDDVLRWKTRPRGTHPASAQRSGVREGLSVVSCFAHPDGALRDCQSDFAAPPGYGFDEAAVQAAGQARVEPRDDRTARPVSFTIRFRME